jgi:ABC-type Fe3+ transport system permease subunit
MQFDIKTRESDVVALKALIYCLTPIFVVLFSVFIYKFYNYLTFRWESDEEINNALWNSLSWAAGAMAVCMILMGSLEMFHKLKPENKG